MPNDMQTMFNWIWALGIGVFILGAIAYTLANWARRQREAEERERKARHDLELKAAHEQFLNEFAERIAKRIAKETPLFCQSPTQAQ